MLLICNFLFDKIYFEYYINSSSGRLSEAVEKESHHDWTWMQFVAQRAARRHAAVDPRAAAGSENWNGFSLWLEDCAD